MKIQSPIDSVSSSGREITIAWPDGPRSFHAIWLRDSCPCTECRHETSGQRLLDTASIPRDIAISSADTHGDGSIEIAWDGGHTDNPYRDPPPSLQLLHCLSSSATGGENTLVDGFRVAHELSRMDPEAFDLLSSQPVRFTYRDETTELTTRVPIITVTPWGEITSIRFNNRSKAPLQMEEHLIGPFYDAYRTFARLLADPRFEIHIALEPEDLLIMDNLRVLHGRTGFSAAGRRHLQGCYADRDGLRSRLAVLNRYL
jgi:alpha-ketoglutarate-dependent taurine dioxygenase